MRISGGALARRSLHAPAGLATRPTTDKVRQALFNILGPLPEGARVLDLFAGTGALGIEALSRGAGQVVFVEQDLAALSALRRNLQELALTGQAQVHAGEVSRFLAKLAKGPGPGFALVLADPPYRDAAAQLPALLALLGAAPALLAPQATVVVEYEVQPRASLSLAQGYGALQRADERVYGQTGLAFYVAQSAQTA